MPENPAQGNLDNAPPTRAVDYARASQVATPPRAGGLSWRFPRTFWFANVAELFERAAYYGMFIALTLYLTDRIGFGDVATGLVGAAFASILYLLPTFSGIMADRIGFRRALMLAFALLAIGYTLLGVAGLPAPAASAEAARSAAELAVPATGAEAARSAAELAVPATGAEAARGAVELPSQAAAPTGPVLLFSEPLRKGLAVLALVIAMFGGSIIKPVITGTVAKCSTEATRARAFSIFYAMVNIGSFTGKSIAKPLRTGFTIPGTDVHLELGLEYINFYAGLMGLLGLVLVALAYRNPDTRGAGKTMREAWQGLVTVLQNFRFMALIIIVAGFWAIQHQLYATMPKYITRLIGPHASPEWLANINPAVVVLCVVLVTHLVRGWRAVNSIAVSLVMITISALSVSFSPVLQASFGRDVPVLGLLLHPVTVMVIIGIGIQGLAECFLSPKFLEYASKQAPPGETGLYMGYSHLTSFFAYFFGFGVSGWLLKRYCPDPTTLPAADYAQWQAATAVDATAALPAQYAHAHYIWFIFAGVGLTALVALLVFRYVTARLDQPAAAGDED
ncbi:MAG: MFS transporter [Planctomycetota bacterium]